VNGSYKIKDFSSNIDAEVKRLKGQVDLFFEKEFKVYQEIGLKDGMKIIECGCGPGFLLLRILERLPQCQVTGLENDPYLFKLLNQNIKMVTSDVKTVERSITETGLDNNSYDIGICRLVFEHLPEPSLALLELFRILKPGGKLVIISNDFENHLITYPAVDELDLMYQAYCRSRIDEGGNPYIGRELPGLMEETNFINISFNAVCAHSKIDGDKAFLEAENVNISKKLVEKGYLQKEILQRLAEKWHTMIKSENHSMTRQLYIVGGKKPESSDKIKKIGQKQSLKNESSSILLENILRNDDDSKKASILMYLKRKVSHAMEITASQLKNEIPLSDLGIDSLAAVEINAGLKKDFQLDLSISDLLDKYSINDIGEKIENHLSNLKTTDPDEGNDHTVWEEGEL
jgi:ubiquinone/menaquinone biosynthesis C-methylase UbiE/acyl carrier protein